MILTKHTGLRKSLHNFVTLFPLIVFDGKNFLRCPVHKQYIVGFLINNQNRIRHFILHTALPHMLFGDTAILQQQIVYRRKRRFGRCILCLTVKFSIIKGGVGLLEHLLKTGAVRISDHDAYRCGNTQCFSVKIVLNVQPFT